MFARLAPIALLALATVPAAALADDVTLYETGAPGGFLGFWGPDVFPGQSVASRFTPTENASLAEVAVWFMSNDWDGTTPQTVTVTLRTDTSGGGFASIPSETILESWTVDLTVVGWNPELSPFPSVSHPALTAGVKYWIVAESNVQGGLSPVWVYAGEGEGFNADTDGPGTPWESIGGGALGMKITGSTSAPSCPADLGAAGGVAGHDGMLDNNDFIAFINHFFNQNAAADVGVAGGGYGHDGAWDNNDFIAFINLFFNGCN
ncbi:MAG: GC-type dockerin domain-anchored protein [Phycisphaerales bacterium]